MHHCAAAILSVFATIGVAGCGSSESDEGGGPTALGAEVAVGSVAFPNVYLRLDGAGISSKNDFGAGVVNAQFGAGDYEKFRVEEQADGTIALASVAFPNVYLRMDGAGVSTKNDFGAGVVNAQFGVGPYEKLRIEQQADGTVAVESVAFPNVYLRLDGAGISSKNDFGAGIVNCQFGVGPYERLRIE